MATKLHASLTDVDGLHEPKGASSAIANSVYVANGEGGGNFKIPEVLGDATANSFKLNNTVSEIISIPLLDKPVLATNAPSIVKTDGQPGGLGVGVQGYSFSDAATSNLFFAFQLPYKLKDFTSITPILKWYVLDQSIGDTVWEFEYLTYNDNLVSGYTTILQVTSTTAAQGFTPIVAEFPTINSGEETTYQVLKGGTFLNCRLSRLGGDAADTLAASAVALVMDFVIQVDKLGR